MSELKTITTELRDSDKPQTGKSPQTQERADVSARVLSVFDDKRAMRDQSHELFRDRTLASWIDDNVKRYIQFKRRPAHKKNWQSNLASSTPNEKLIGILSKLATQGMECKVVSVDELNSVTYQKERIFNAMLKKAGIKNDDDFQIILEMMEACEKGTVIGMEDWFFGKRKRKIVDSIDPETGELKYKEKTENKWNDVRSTLVNLEDFYPGDIYVRPGQIQDMDDCFLRTIVSENQFLDEYGGYTDADKVQTVNQAINNESTPFWKQSDYVGDDQVEILRYFNKITDEYILIANGIWINPEGKSGVQPLPWNHKELPFWGAVFEPLDTQFFYGRGVIDKLISYSDGKDALFDRILDQMTLAVNAPIITDGKAASLTKGFLQPQNVIQADYSNGKPQFDVVPIQPPSPVSISLYQIMQQNLESATVSSEVLGGQSRSKKTAEEVATQREAALELVSLFLKFIERGIRQKNKLRLANQIQFYSMPGVEGKFKVIVLRDTELGDGKRGTMRIEITPEGGTPESQARVEESSRMSFESAEFAEIRPDFIRNFEWDIDVVPQSSIKMTPAQRQILELNYQRIMAELYPDKFNRDAGFEELNRKFDKDPNKMKLKEQPKQEGLGGSLGDMAGQGAGQGQEKEVPQLENIPQL